MKVELLDVFGDDLTVVNSARVSFNKWKDAFDESDEKLINYLIKHDHWTPFSHPQIRLRISAPIFIAREWYRHTIGATRNEVSRRYVTDEPEFWEPDYLRYRPENMKQGSLDEKHDTSDYYCAKMKSITEICKKLYLDMVNVGIAPEQARAILPQSMITTWIETGSLYFYLRVLKLRLDPHAQKEIRQLALQLEEIIKDKFPVSYKSFLNNVILKKTI